MYKVKGFFRNGVAFPEQPINGWDGEQVIITFVDKETAFESESDAYPTLEQVVDRIMNMGPNPNNIIEPTESLADLLANAPGAAPIDAIAWNRQWAALEAEMKERDLADDRAEGRL